MGFFSWFRRKPSGAAGEEATAAPVAAEESTQDGPEPAESVEGGSELSADPGSASEAGIPKQQSAEVAADNEAGENARA
ncbi:hypothetical protein [Streptomyces sp. NPDC047097]|uniref:hypothetical protein n=1 Tax=Streptomyces sp. NPDC047097 TaxID=3155260 RepID=UPI0033D140C5